MNRTVTVTLSLPDNIIEQLERTAAAAHRSLDDVIAADVLAIYTVDPESNQSLNERLKVLDHYSDTRLIALVEWRPAPRQLERYEELVEKREFDTLSEQEQQELSRWVRLLELQMLIRAQALVLLKERGYDIEPFLETANAKDS